MIPYNVRTVLDPKKVSQDDINNYGLICFGVTSIGVKYYYHSGRVNSARSTEQTQVGRIVTTPAKSGTNKQVASHWQKHKAVEKHIASGQGPTPDIINNTLFNNTIVDERHIAVCREVMDNSYNIPLPVPGTAHGGNIPSIGIANAKAAREQNSQFPGCYYINSTQGSYVGQTVHLGSRLREHGGGQTNTGSWLGPVAMTSTVQVYHLPSNTLNLSRTEFLCVLELYLFIVLAPTKNATYVPTPGFMHSPEDILTMSIAKSTKLHAYTINDNGSYNLLYTSTGHRRMGNEVMTEKTILAVVSRGGWYRKVLFFSPEELCDDITPSMSIEDFQDYVKTLTKDSSRYNQPGGYKPNVVTPGFNVIVENMKTNKTEKYDSKHLAAKDLQCNRTTLDKYAESGKLFRDTYRITIIKEYKSPSPKK